MMVPNHDLIRRASCAEGERQIKSNCFARQNIAMRKSSQPRGRAATDDLIRKSSRILQLELCSEPATPPLSVACGTGLRATATISPRFPVCQFRRPATVRRRHRGIGSHEEAAHRGGLCSKFEFFSAVSAAAISGPIVVLS